MILFGYDFGNGLFQVINEVRLLWWLQGGIITFRFLLLRKDARILVHILVFVKIFDCMLDHVFVMLHSLPPHLFHFFLYILKTTEN